MNIIHHTIKLPNGDRETLTFHRHAGYTKRDVAEEILERVLVPFSGEKVWDGEWSKEDLNDLTVDEIAFVIDIDDLAAFVNDQHYATWHMLQMDELPESCNHNIEKALQRLAETIGITFEVS